MSIAVMTAVWSLDLPDSQKIVLLALADCANDEGLCWPSMATLTKKCSKGERTIQGVIKQLVEAGHLSRFEVVGKGCKYQVHPRTGCAPAKSAPPQGTTQTPAEAADKPSRTIIKKPKGKSAHEIPTGWQPLPFGRGTKSSAIVDGWSPDERDRHLEHFIAHHTARRSKFDDWQAAWSTWVLNSAKFGGQRNGNANRANAGQGGYGRSSLARAIDEGLEWLQ